MQTISNSKTLKSFFLFVILLFSYSGAKAGLFDWLKSFGNNTTTSSNFVSLADYQIDDVNGQTISVCSGDFYDSNGAGVDYNNNENYSVTFCSDNGGTLSMAFYYFNIEYHGSCGYDFLNIYDGTNNAAPLIGKYCGTTNPGTITSTGTCLHFYFSSDNIVPAGGWGATISCGAPSGGGGGGSGSSALCCTDNLLADPSLEAAFTPNARFPNSTITSVDNSRTTTTTQWAFADGSNSNGMILIDENSKASDGDQFAYIKTFGANSTYNRCIGNSISRVDAGSFDCSVEEYTNGIRYVISYDFAAFNQAVPNGGSAGGYTSPRFEHDFPETTDLYDENGNYLSEYETPVGDLTGYTEAADWNDLENSWIKVYGITPAMDGESSETMWVSHADDGTAGMLVDNVSLVQLSFSDAGVDNITCGAANNQISFTLNPDVNFKGVPGIKYTLTAPSGYSVSPTEGTYGQNVPFTLTKQSGDFETGSLFSVTLEVRDEVNTSCGADAVIINPFPCTGVIGNMVWLDENTDGIQDAGEPGIPGVEVTLLDAFNNTIATTITDANGGYIFNDVPEGLYTVKVISGSLPTGLNSIYDEDNGTSSPNYETVVNVSNDEEYVTADFGYNYVTKPNTDSPSSMSTTGALGNRVWNDANNNGIQDPGEAGIEGVTVTLLSDPDNDGIYTNSTTTTTDAFGNYIFDDLAPGAYVVEVTGTDISSAGFNTVPTGDPDSDNNNTSEPIIIAPGDVWLGGDFGYNTTANPADIGSRVYIDRNGNGSDNAGEPGIEGVSVALIKDTNNDGDWDTGEPVVATTITDSNGDYLFPDLPNGNYVVVVTDTDNILDNYDNTGDPDGGNNEYSDVTLNNNNQLNENFGYAPKGHTVNKGFIGDFVYLDADNDGNQDSNEPGIEGVIVYLLDDNTNEILALSVTDENGKYFFGNLDDNDYRVKVISTTLPAGLSPNDDPDGSSPADYEGGTVTIAGGSSDLNQDFGFAADTPRTISGTVWEDNNAEGTLDASESIRFEMVSLILIDANDNIIATTETDASGNYSFTGIPAGVYTVEVTDNNDTLADHWHSLGSDSESDPVNVDATAGNVTDIDFGYYKKAAALGNTVWEDLNNDGLQDNNEKGIPGVVVNLGIDYNNDGTDDIIVSTITDNDGFYSFSNLLLDEDYNGGASGTEPAFSISVNTPDRFTSSVINANANGNDDIDSDDPNGVDANPVQGITDVTKQTNPASETSVSTYDFGFVRTGTIGNYVWIDENTDGFQDTYEPGIPGVTVDLLDDNNVKIASTITDANGGYIFRNVSPGDYTVEIGSGLPAGLVAIYDEDGTLSTPNGETVVSLTSGQEHMSADFGYHYTSKTDTDSPTNMTATGGFGDRIWNDANSNGLQDPGEAGIEGVTVILLTDPDLDGVYEDNGVSTTTDANGRYFFDNLTPGGYMVEVDESGLTGFITTPTGDPDNDSDNFMNPIVIAPGDVWFGGDFGYATTSNLADIGSYVYIDIDGDGNFDNGTDPGVRGVSVALISDTNNDNDWDAGEPVVATTVTDENGAYLFPNLPDGNYTVVVTDTDNILNGLDNTGDPDNGNNSYSGVDINAADELNENFGYAPENHTTNKGFIGDLVFLDMDGNGAFTSGEPGIEGITVQLLDDNSGRVLSITTTDENGNYFFGNLPDRTYRVKVDETSLPFVAAMNNSVDPGGSTAGDHQGGTVTISGGSNNLVQDFGYVATTPRTISGTVWHDINAEGTLDGSESDRFQKVSIILLDANNNIIASTETDANGDYSFTGLPPAVYTVEITDAQDVLATYWHSTGTDSENDPVSADVSSTNKTGIDFGYYNKGAALGNLIWVDYNGDGTQDTNEPGLEGAKITLEIDYNNDNIVDVTMVTISGMTGNYGFTNLLLDEDYQGDGVGNEPAFEILVDEPNDAFSASIIYQGADTKDDSDNHSGTTAQPVQGNTDISMANKVEDQASFDFAYEFDCSRPSVDYAVTTDATDPGASLTTTHFLQNVNGVEKHAAVVNENSGVIRCYTYCLHNGWRYYYNPLDPDEYLFAIRMNAQNGVIYNTTEIEYIEIRLDDNASDRYAETSTDFATYAMIRDWHVKTVNDAPLTAPIDARFYFPENEFKQMYDAAVDKAINDWGVGTPGVDLTQWFKKDTFDPENDIDIEGTVLDGYDINALRNGTTNEQGSNSSDTNTDGAQAVGNNKNHIQFNSLASIGGGTANITIQQSVLPVELTRFEGAANGCDIVLTWTSASELNFSHYEIERSFDGDEFEMIERVNSSGGESSATYQFTDTKAGKSNYYRLRMVDHDGSFEYSNLVTVKSDCEVIENITLYPNPVADRDVTIKIKSRIETAEEIKIIDIMGRVVHKGTLKLNEGFNTFQYNTSHLIGGLYIIKIGKRTKVKFTKIAKK